jgi:hypothetical protein
MFTEKLSRWRNIVSVQQGTGFALLKFGERSFMERFLRGELYMNTLEYFASKERNRARADRCEGNSYWLRSEECTLSIQHNGVFVPIGGLTGPLAYTGPQDENVNIFCMYALYSASPWVDSRNQNFGDTFVVVTQPEAFLQRINRTAEVLGYAVEHGLVQYVNESTYSGPIGTFRKAGSFSYQSEFRIAIRAESSKPLTLHIGDISGIAKAGPLADLNDRICVRKPD